MKQDSEILESSPLVMFGAPKTSYLLNGGQGGASGYDGPFQFDQAKEKIVNCRLMFGRSTLSCGDVDCTKEQFETSRIYAVVSHAGSGKPVLSVEITSPDAERNSTLYKTYRLLYDSRAANDGGTASGDGGRVVVDYRFMPVIAALE